MNPIKNIEIKNFKSIRHQTIDDCKRINVFIGYPNVGKSNILEALSLFSIDKGDVDFSAFVRVAELTTLFFDGNINEKIEIRINNENRIITTLESNKVHFHWQLLGADASFDKMGPGVQQKIYSILNFSKIEGEDKVSNWDSIFSRLPRSPDFYKELGDGYLSPIKKYSFQKNPVFISGKYDSLSVPNGENIFDIIYTHPDIRKEIANLFEMYDLNLLYDSTKKKFSILKTLSKDIIFTISYDLIADTLQRLIFYKAAVLSNKESILLFEEPEAHMFPPYINKFTTDVIFDKTNQFFITTHSPYVLDELILEAEDELSVYLVDYKDGETKIHHLSSSDLKEVREYGVDLFFNIESYLKHGQVNNA
jgi:AAA15 family ATPase/GTPase